MSVMLVLRYAFFTSMIAALGVLTGCRNWPLPQPWAYVRDVGGPREITAWALKQKDADRIGDAMNTLAELACGEREGLKNPRQADEAIIGFERIYVKLLAGWPGFTGRNRYDPPGHEYPATEVERLIRLEREIDMAYAALVYSGCERTVQLFFKLKPDKSRFPNRFDSWEENARLGNHVP